MKKFSLLCLFLSPLFIAAQDCKGFYFLQNNKTIEITLYDSDGKENGKVIHKVSNVASSGNSLSSVINTESFNKKGKSISTGTNNITCSGGVMMMDMKMNLSKEQQRPFANATGEVNNAYIEYPADLKVGDDLKDAMFTINTKTNGMDQTTELQTNNRKVLAKETITSTAGTWECYKISYKSKITTKMMGMSIPINMEGTEWFCPGFGIVKTETKYGTTLVTSVKE